MGVPMSNDIDAVPLGVCWGSVGVDGGRCVFISIVADNFRGFQIAYEHYSGVVKFRNIVNYGGYPNKSSWYGWSKNVIG